MPKCSAFHGLQEVTATKPAPRLSSQLSTKNHHQLCRGQCTPLVALDHQSCQLDKHVAAAHAASAHSSYAKSAPKP